MSQRQGSRTWVLVAVLVILSLTTGLGLGLVIGWVIMPVKYVDTAFADLRVESKEEYILLVASAYTCDQDLEKARTRLSFLEAPNVNQWVADMVDRYIDEGRDQEDLQALVALAHGLGVDSPRMLAYMATPTPPPTVTLPPTPTPAPSDTPTATPIPSTASPTPEPPTASPTSQPPTATPEQAPATSVPPSDTPPPQPTATSVPPTNTPPSPTNTPKPKPTNPPKPTNTPKPPAAKWTVIEQRLVGPGEDGQGCDYGNLQIRVAVVDAKGNQLGGVWVYDKYSQQYQLTGNIDSPDWGPGETKFEYGGGGGGSLCIAQGQGGPCVSGWTRDMPCYFLPPFEDLWNAGYCQCEKSEITREECERLINEGKFMATGAGHFSWRVTFQRSH